MNYKKILKQLATKENVPEKEIEKEMELAISLAGLDCSARKFIDVATKTIEKRLYIVR